MNWRTEDRILRRFMDGESIWDIVAADYPDTRDPYLTATEQAIRNAIRRRDRKRQKRFFLDQDNSCHWYLVPLDKQDEWERWCALDEEDEASCNAPDWARRLGTHPKWVSFTDPLEAK